MAEASSSSFDDWICSLLNDLQSNDTDMSDFVQYLLGIVTSDNETDEEKQTAIAELLADLDLKVKFPFEFRTTPTHFQHFRFSMTTISTISANKFLIDGTNHKIQSNKTETNHFE